MEERENWVCWTVWIQWPDTSGPQKYDAVGDTSAQCTLMPSSYIGVNLYFKTNGGSQGITVLEAEVNLTGNE